MYSHNCETSKTGGPLRSGEGVFLSLFFFFWLFALVLKLKGSPRKERFHVSTLLCIPCVIHVIHDTGLPFMIIQEYS